MVLWKTIDKHVIHYQECPARIVSEVSTSGLTGLITHASIQEEEANGYNKLGKLD